MRTRRPRILLDVDGVAADFVGGVLPVVREVTGRTCTHADVTRHDGWLAALGLTEQEREAVNAKIGERGFCRALKLIPDAVWGVTELRALGDVYAVTTPWDGDYWARERERWLIEELGFARRHIWQGTDKFTVHGDLLVDDKTANVIAWEDENCYASRTPSGKPAEYGVGVLFERPWNAEDAWEGLRVDSWGELVDLVKRYAEARS